MTQEEKTILLQDLCARLPYSVKGEINFEQDNFNVFDVEVNHIMPIQGDMVCLYSKDFNGYNLDDFKPYLRPMSSMTEDEEKEYFSFYFFEKNCFNNTIGAYKLLDWLNAHHFDYRRLIEKGLAIEAPEGMYNTKTK